MSENQKKIWITGASSGIGKALAERFALEGWKVAVSARRKEILDEMANNKNIYSYPLDVTNQNQVNDIFTKICREKVMLQLQMTKDSWICEITTIQATKRLKITQAFRISKKKLSLSISHHFTTLNIKIASTHENSTGTKARAF